MSLDHFQEKCQICDRNFDYEPHAYLGKYLSRYKMMACTSCLRAHHDGWSPEAEKRILVHLKQKELDVPKRNAAGWLPTE